VKAQGDFDNKRATFEPSERTKWQQLPAKIFIYHVHRGNSTERRAIK
jgi:hypothetical protein